MIGPAPMMRIDLISVRFGMALAQLFDTLGEKKESPGQHLSRSKPARQLSTAARGKIQTWWLGGLSSGDADGREGGAVGRWGDGGFVRPGGSAPLFSMAAISQRRSRWRIRGRKWTVF